MIVHSRMMIILRSETVFLSIVESKQWSFSRSDSFSASIFTLVKDLLFCSMENDVVRFYSNKAVYSWSGPNGFCFFKFKSAAPWSNFNPWTLCIVDAYVRATRNWVLLNDGDVDPFSILFNFSRSLPNSAVCWNGLQLLPLNQFLDRNTEFIPLEWCFDQCQYEQLHQFDHLLSNLEYLCWQLT